MVTSSQQVLDREETGMIRLRMTYQEWLDTVDEHAHTEWVDGEAFIYSPPGLAHHDGVVFLAVLLRMLAELRDLGKVMMAPLEMRLAKVNASREPDALFIARQNLHRLTDVRLEGPADVAIEGMSTSAARYDRQVKLVEYEGAGVPEAWFVDHRPGHQPF
jgi:Uma2 family endonuclease